jgi:hypothetical protein
MLLLEFDAHWTEAATPPIDGMWGGRYQAFETAGAMCDAVLGLCELDILRRRRAVREAEHRDTGAAYTDIDADLDAAPLQYDTLDMIRFIDVSLREARALALNVDVGTYSAHGKPWLKEQLLKHLDSAASIAGM